MTAKLRRRNHTAIVLTILLASVVPLLTPGRAAAQSCVSGSSSIGNLALSQTYSGSVHVTFDATPAASLINAMAGVSAGSATSVTSLAAAVRFNTTGAIDVRNGSTFTAATSVPYSGRILYHFILDINVSTHTFNAYVVANSVQKTLGTNIAFRTEQAGVTSLKNFAVVSTSGLLNVCNVTTSSTSLNLNPNSTSLNFGQVAVSGSASQNVIFTNAGTSSITISQVAISGAGYTASGGAAGLILSPNQTATVKVTFAPSSTGTHTGTLTVSSNAKNSPSSIPLTGSGVTSSGHSVALSWSPSSGAIGYNVYVSSTSGGPYTRVNGSYASSTSYTDANVSSGHTYYFVVTSVNSANQESTHSSQVSAVIP